MDNETYILLSRSILESEVFSNEKMLKIWIWLIAKANFKDRFASLKIGAGQSSVEVKRGQLLFGRFSAENELGISGSTIYKILQKLEQIGNITIESNSHYSIITICNYDKWQDINTYLVTTDEQPSNNRVTAKEQPSNTPKESNTLKESKESKEKEHLETFENFRKLYGGKKRGCKTEFENFKKKHEDWEEVLPLLLPAIDNHLRYRNYMINNKPDEFLPQWKNLQTWINQRDWEIVYKTNEKGEVVCM